MSVKSYVRSICKIAWKYKIGLICRPIRTMLHQQVWDWSGVNLHHPQTATAGVTSSPGTAKYFFSHYDKLFSVLVLYVLILLYVITLIMSPVITKIISMIYQTWENGELVRLAATSYYISGIYLWSSFLKQCISAFKLVNSEVLQWPSTRKGLCDGLVLCTSHQV